jgi:hypothetical protein
MGLLDDAIREHLELKRRHGADPAEVAAQEREVLGPGRTPVAEPAAATDLSEPAAVSEPPLAEEPAVAEAPLVPDAPPEPDIPLVPDTPPPPSPDDALPPTDPFLDEAPAPADPPPPAPEAAGAVSAERFAPEPDLDWSDPAPLDAEAEPAAENEGEDVLEETPEFLEETPEHDRLWFEQRPPKDFDF